VSLFSSQRVAANMAFRALILHVYELHAACKRTRNACVTYRVRRVRVAILAVEKQFTLVLAMKAQRGSKGVALFVLYPRRQKRVGGQRHALTTLSLGKKPGTHCTGGWVGPIAGLDGC